VVERFILDTSALLALLFEEPGRDVVQAAITEGDTAMSAVNFAEVVGKLVHLGAPGKEALRGFRPLGIDVVDFDHAQAVEVGTLEPVLHRRNTSFADRACLALARMRKWPALTADRPWASLDIGVEVRLIR
jgi:PIN domain nuclease of toxin-antitoxin system